MSLINKVLSYDYILGTKIQEIEYPYAPSIETLLGLLDGNNIEYINYEHYSTDVNWSEYCTDLDFIIHKDNIEKVKELVKTSQLISGYLDYYIANEEHYPAPYAYNSVVASNIELRNDKADIIVFSVKTLKDCEYN